MPSLAYLPPEGDRRENPSQSAPVSTAPMYAMGDPRQWLSYALDKGPVTVIAFYILTRIEPLLTQLVAEVHSNTQQLQNVQHVIERLPH